MYKNIPPLSERVDELKQCLQHERDGRKKPRVQMLYLLAREHLLTRQDVARLRGVRRNTVGRWRALYEAGGVVALLDIYVPPGNRPSLAPAIRASIEQARQQPAGFGSYGAVRPWGEQTQHVQVQYKTLYTLVRTRVKAKRKVLRPRHIKKA